VFGCGWFYKVNLGGVENRLFGILLNIRYGEAFKTETGKCLLDAFYSYFKVFLDGSYVDLPLESSGKLKDDDKLLIFRPVSGG
jgi:hypothetical protein